MTSKSSASLTSAGSTRTLVATHDRHQRRVDVGLREEDRRADLADHARVGEVLHAQRRRAVGLVAGVGREALADLLLHHDQHPA